MRALLTVFAALTTLALTGCSPDPGPHFDDEGAAAVTCMRHQPAGPGPRYADAASRRTADLLPLLRYYTANGAKGYCDGGAPTEADRAWARLYVDLGADPAQVAALLG